MYIQRIFWKKLGKLKFKKEIQKFFSSLEMANNEKISLVLGVLRLFWRFWPIFHKKISDFRFWKNAITREPLDIARRGFQDVFYPWAGPLDQVWAKTERNWVIYGQKWTKNVDFSYFGHFFSFSYEILPHVWRSNSALGWPTEMIELLGERRDHLQAVNFSGI